MRMSASTTSGRSRRARSRAAAPSAASPTTAMSGWASRMSRKPLRTSSWSSAIRIRVRVMAVDADTAPAAGPDSGRVASTRQPPCARAGGQRAAERLDPLGEPDQAEAARRPRPPATGRPPPSSTRDASRESSRTRVDADRDPGRRRRVAAHVGERLRPRPGTTVAEVSWQSMSVQARDRREVHLVDRRGSRRPASPVPGRRRAAERRRSRPAAGLVRPFAQDRDGPVHGGQSPQARPPRYAAARRRPAPGRVPRRPGAACACTRIPLTSWATKSCSSRARSSAWARRAAATTRTVWRPRRAGSGPVRRRDDEQSRPPARHEGRWRAILGRRDAQLTSYGTVPRIGSSAAAVPISEPTATAGRIGKRRTRTTRSTASAMTSASSQKPCRRRTRPRSPCHRRPGSPNGASRVVTSEPAATAATTRTGDRGQEPAVAASTAATAVAAEIGGPNRNSPGVQLRRDGFQHDEEGPRPHRPSRPAGWRSVSENMPEA